mmetsp:Transcript_14142/g.23528  ORF Transcript_14142/g.23528 Transcript_14142/m.23528 type:complete len:251 (+) Transcript_14142:57-809(+)
MPYELLKALFVRHCVMLVCLFIRLNSRHTFHLSERSLLFLYSFLASLKIDMDSDSSPVVRLRWVDTRRICFPPSSISRRTYCSYPSSAFTCWTTKVAPSQKHLLLSVRCGSDFSTKSASIFNEQSSSTRPTLSCSRSMKVVPVIRRVCVSWNRAASPAEPPMPPPCIPRSRCQMPENIAPDIVPAPPAASAPMEEEAGRPPGPIPPTPAPAPTPAAAAEVPSPPTVGRAATGMEVVRVPGRLEAGLSITD